MISATEKRIAKPIAALAIAGMSATWAVGRVQDEQASLSQRAAVELWNKISSSIRLHSAHKPRSPAAS